MAEVVFDGIFKSFGKVEAVRDVNLHIKDREFTVLVGPSGCGKSTLLRMTAGLEEITKGKIFIDGKLVNNLHPKDRNIAMVFQDYGLYPHMTVYNNMAFGLKLKKRPKPEIEKRVKEAAEILGIVDLLGRRPLQLSGGQRQRVALGRAIVRKPAIFLFDEPLSNLDAKLRLQMRAELTMLHERLQSTIIYVTHDQVEAMTMGSKIVIMNAGRMHQVGSPLEVYRFPKNRFVAGFLGNPPMNFMLSRIMANGSGLAVEVDNMKLPVPESKSKQYEHLAGKEVIFGIRPEHIHEKTANMDCLPGTVVSAKVDLIEPLGSETLLNMTAGHQRFIGKSGPLTRIELHQEVNIFIDMTEMHIFEKDGEQLRVRAEKEDLSNLSRPKSV